MTDRDALIETALRTCRVVVGYPQAGEMGPEALFTNALIVIATCGSYAASRGMPQETADRKRGEAVTFEALAVSRAWLKLAGFLTDVQDLRSRPLPAPSREVN